MKPVMYPKTFSGLPAVQVKSELAGLIKLLKKEGVKSYLEIGVARGDTFHEITSSLPRGSRAVAVDMPQAAWGLDGSKAYLDKAVENLARGYDARVIYGSSSAPGIVEEVEELGPFDAVLIDGDHTLEGVRADWDNYGRLGKLVIFHDIVDDMRPNRRGERIDVPLFWAGLKKQYPHAEFIGKHSEMGIGVLFLGEYMATCS